MPKGRNFAPSSEVEGIWFRHASADQTKPRKDYSTSTGRMLSAPFLSEHRDKSPPPPLPIFHEKTEVNYKHANKFSDHDNRHHFQDHGVYFGDGKISRNLGKRVLSVPERLHHTDKDFLKNFCKNPTDSDFHTTYCKTYYGKSGEHTPIFRRFPKSFIGETQQRKIGLLDDKTFEWFNQSDGKFRTPTHVLAVSQEPYLKHNAWKYSNNGQKKIYPPYTLKQTLKVDNILNRYGASFVK